jgi:acetyl-CoA synthetase
VSLCVFRAPLHQRYSGHIFLKAEVLYRDGALRDEMEAIRITGRVDDVVIVSGHNREHIEDSIVNPAVAESAIVGFPHDVKRNALYGFVILKESGEIRNKRKLVQRN